MTTFFLREPSRQPTEVILLTPAPDGGFMVNAFDWNVWRHDWDQAAPLFAPDLESARTCVPDYMRAEPCPPEEGIECYVAR